MTLRKEFLILFKDLGGLAVLFIMPVVLVIVVTLIQNNTYENITNQKMKVLVIDNDKGKVSQQVLDEITQSGSFEIIQSLDGSTQLDENRLQEEVIKGNYQLAIVIPSNLTSNIQKQIDSNVEQVLEAVVESSESSTAVESQSEQEVRLYFDPALQIAFREGIKSAIDKIVGRIENKFIYQAFAEQLELPENSGFLEQKNLVVFNEIVPQEKELTVLPNAVQHNVPAWSLFAIFFIIVPFAMNLLKEKNQGTKVRLYTMPTNTFILWTGKIVTYLLICILQFYLILIVGRYVFPLIGLMPFMIGDQLLNLTVLTLAVGLSAISIGVLFGTFAKTEEQSSPFGATFVVILAAVSGVWVPTFAMPIAMQYIAKLSPMNWGLEGYYTLLLRQGSLWQIKYEIILLLLFSSLMISIALWYDKKKRSL